MTDTPAPSCPFVPPYPKPHTSKLGATARFLVGWNSWIHTLFEKSYRMKMGEIRLPGLNFFIPNQPDLANFVMDYPAAFPKHSLLHEVLYPLIGDSIFSINGEAWRTARTMVNPAFAHTRLDRVFPTMDAAAHEMIARMQAMDLSRPINVDPIMAHVAADVIFRTIISRSLTEEEARAVFNAFEVYQRNVQPAMILRSYGLPIGFYRKRMLKAAATIHAVLNPIIQARHTAFHAGEGSPDDILKTLMEATHPTTGQPFTYKELVDQVAIIFLAGHETTASALTWALYLIASCPEQQEIFRAEAIANEPLSPEALRGMEQIRDVFRESMRLYPPVSFLMREVAQPTTMRNKQMKPGDLVVVSPWLIQRNEDNFPCPHAFMPERFRDPEQKTACREAYLPFGKGPRICIGAGFAQQEGSLILARILQHFRLSVPEGFIPEPVSRLTLRPKRGMPLMLHPLSPEVTTP